MSDGAEKRQLHRSYLVHTHARTRTQVNTHARTHTHTDSACVERAHTGATSMINLPQPLLCFETTRRYTAIGRGRHPAAGREVAGSSPPARSSRTKPTPHHEHSARALSPALCWTSLMLRHSRHAGCHCGCCTAVAVAVVVAVAVAIAAGCTTAAASHAHDHDHDHGQPRKMGEAQLAARSWNSALAQQAATARRTPADRMRPRSPPPLPPLLPPAAPPPRSAALEPSQSWPRGSCRRPSAPSAA